MARVGASVATRTVSRTGLPEGRNAGTPRLANASLALFSMPLLFVYGSLKEGYPNHPVNRGRRVPGEFRTAQAYPMVLVESVLPCLFLRSGEGLPVKGQLFEVDAAALATMDALERIGEPGGYQRVTIDVVPLDAPDRPTPAFVYVQDAALLERNGPHLGPIAEYTMEHAKALRW